MRNSTQIAAALSRVLARECGNVLAVAIGGSHSTAQSDDQSDLDLVVLLEDGPLLEQSAGLARVLLPLVEEPVQVVGPPTWKEGFGCRTSVLYADGFKLEIFAVTHDTAPVAERVLRWTPVWGEDALQELQRSVKTRLTRDRILAKARFDVTYAHMSVCRHLSRREVFAARHVLTSYAAIALALRLFELGRAYDPVTSYKRIVRDGLERDPGVEAVQRASGGLGGDAGDLLACLRALAACCFTCLHTLTGDSKAAADQRERARAVIASAESWIAAPAA